MYGALQPSSDRHCQFEQLAGFLIQRSAVVNSAAESIISLPNVRIGFLEILVSLWQSGHETSFFRQNDFPDSKTCLCKRSIPTPSIREYWNALGELSHFQKCPAGNARIPAGKFAA